MGSDYDHQMKRKGFFPYQMGHLTDWMVKLAKDELKESEETRSQAISELRKVIAKHKELNVWIDDAYLLQLLRARKFDVKRAGELLLRFYALKRDYPEIYPPEIDLESIKTAQEEASCCGAFPYRDKNGSIILFYSIGKWDPDKIPVPVAISVATFMLLQCIEDPATQVCGLRLIIDAKNVSLKHMRALTPRYLQLFGKGLRNSLPIRFAGIHITNESIFFSYIFNILKLFLSEKIKKRVHFHEKDMKHLQKHIPKEILPSEFDGDNTNYQASEWVKKEMYSYLEKFGELHRKGYL
ncbi:alpha-tocopherol transfer protein-like [Parasteatoda tepidariorum]|uniref:alpha-tocopherol transfer protein-like n=1 Tax=Parasteatoda tepidariorum TaxID=114398 RepID=UPI001C718F95|nr:alpha-tocopherol transfer protein-like [Parasteatoda tepidariorum]XP_042910567.1 alpha-tocopherol transfer protein-like [Parasteatoda tepidariorum]